MAQSLREGAPEHPNEQSTATSPEDAVICPSGQLNQKEDKKGTHKKRRDQVFKNFIYQNIFNKDRFTNIFKKKIGHSTGGKRNDEDGSTGRNQQNVSVDDQLTNEDEEYMLFLSYIYNDITSFIEINKNYHLKNSNYADLEDLILEICGTVCRDAFRNIKSIFKSPEGGATRQGSVCKHAGDVNDHVGDVNDYRADRYNHDSHGDKGKSEPLQGYSPSTNDSSFFFIPPMEYLVTHIHKLTSKKDDAKNVCHFSSDINEFLKNNNFDKHPIYGSLPRGDNPREDGKATGQGEEADPFFHQEERLLLEDAAEELTPNEKKHDEEGVQHDHAYAHVHTHSPPVEHTQVGTNFEVSSNNGGATIFADVHNFNENEAIWAHRKSPDELTCSLMNEEAHRDIHHYSQSNCSKQVSRSNPEDEVFEDCLDDYVKPARAPKDNQDTDTNDDDSEVDSDGEGHDTADDVDDVASEMGDANGANTPSEDNPPDNQTSNNIRRAEDVHLCGGQNSDQLEDDKEGITTEGKDSPKEQPLKGYYPSKMEQQNEPPQRIIELDPKEYLEKQKKMVKNKTYADLDANPESRREFTKNENPHDDYYHFKYLNKCENISNPYQYTKVEKKANIQVTPSPFPQFLRDIQIYNISQKKIRLKKTNIALRRDDADVGIPEKTTNKKKRQTRKRTK
ncbi:hypothetical protein PCYB_091510 [Plasmodium cynomolgi strain B]|uniref:Uncharacterized protein n=1 Tax=Plasmodium cynomolgi (strain B) TaxID=1120755 RepID=K6UVM4_PLACD|nr:hypothetical protein PCYB_091510 [Plasmodium cynomolgi strain B]GAB66365.1 hypothetical protein PCYB_091510 [Plasmodium cynomolgi strain B]